MTESVSPRIRVALRRLVLDAGAGEVIRELDRRGLRAILLKGPSVARWLYDAEEQRPYVDVDLLVDPERRREAGAALANLGFDLRYEAFGWDRDDHGEHWVRESDCVNIDLHWRIAGVGADPRLAWAWLAATAEHLTVAGTEVEVLGAPARALHLALHAAQHGVKHTQPIVDLSRAVERLPEEQWRAAVTLAGELDARDSLAVGLRLVPGGRPLADRLGLPSEISTHAALVAETPPRGSKRLYEIIAAPGIRTKAHRLGEALVPRPAEVRLSLPWARSGPLALALAYPVRVAVSVGRIPGAIRALARARKRSRRSASNLSHHD